MVSDSIFIRERSISLCIYKVCEGVKGPSELQRSLCVAAEFIENEMVISTAPPRPIRNDRNTDFAPSIFRPSAPAK